MFVRGRLGMTGPLDPDDRFGLRKWWHELLRVYDRYKSYAIFLLLPGDRELIRYLTDFSQELNSLSGENCLVLAIGETSLRRSNVDEELHEEGTNETPLASSESAWQDAMQAQIRGGYSLKFAELFEVSYTELPCLIIFQSIQDLDHLIVPLGEMDTDSIVRRMRSVFFSVQQAAAKTENPLTAVQRRLQHESLSKEGKRIAGGFQILAGKTLQTAMEAWIKAMVGQ